MLLIMFFIIVLNIVAIALIYYCLSDLETREKVIFIAIGVAIIYILTSLVYWVSTKDIAVKAVSDMGKNLITLLFVPINAIIVLPLIAKTYTKYKMATVDFGKLKSRMIIFGAILVILLIFECTYFKDIQSSVISIIEKNRQEQIEKSTPSIPKDLENGQNNEISDINTMIGSDKSDGIFNTMENQTANVIENEMLGITENQIANTIQNQMVNEGFNN